MGIPKFFQTEIKRITKEFQETEMIVDEMKRVARKAQLVGEIKMLSKLVKHWGPFERGSDDKK